MIVCEPLWAILHRPCLHQCMHPFRFSVLISVKIILMENLFSFRNEATGYQEIIIHFRAYLCGKDVWTQGICFYLLHFTVFHMGVCM